MIPGPLSLMDQIRDLGRRIGDLETRRTIIPVTSTDTAALSPTTANVSAVNTAQLVKQGGAVWLYFNVTLAVTPGTNTSLFTIVDARFLPNDSLAAYPAQPATFGAGWFGRITPAGACIIHGTYGTYSPSSNLNGVATFPARIS